MGQGLGGQSQPGHCQVACGSQAACSQQTSFDALSNCCWFAAIELMKSFNDFTA
jgi:hypothetical protein